MEDIFRIADNTVMTAELLQTYISNNETNINNRYRELLDAYETNYPIFSLQKKEPWKPDNRLAVNFAKFIVDTFEGFFLGNPIKITSEDAKISEYVNYLDAYNDQDDQNSELSSLVSIFGRAYEMYYVDEEGENCIAYLDPIDAFMIYSDSIKPRPRYFVRTYIDADGVKRGSISDSHSVRYFYINPDLVFTNDEHIHGYDGVPAAEYVMNRSRQGIFEPVLPLINAYNKALSEKANDVDYFADAYLKILGKQLDEETTHFIRSNRIINFEGSDVDKLVVEFLQKPDGDTTQENLLNRLQMMIFTIAMVCNISDENFATSSGIALKYKLLPMINLAKRKERKFTSGMNRRYKLLFSNPVSGMNKKSWVKLDYKFTFNIPVDLADEVSQAKALSGIVSKKTQLSVLSIVNDVDKEIEQMEKEEQEASVIYSTDRGIEDDGETTEQT